MRNLVIAGFLCTSAVAFADNAVDEARQKARAHFRAGTAFYEVGGYDRAIVEYEEAYRLLPLPELLFNLGQAARLKGDVKLAAAYYRRFLEAKPTGELTDEARARLRELSVETEPPPAPAPLPPAAPRAVQRPPPLAPAAVQPTQPSKIDLSPAAQAPAITTRTPPRPLYKKWWFWTVTAAAAGVAATVIAVGVVEGQPRETLLRVRSP
jgi:tetratricopeptide (TPR) repeat protein